VPAILAEMIVTPDPANVPIGLSIQLTATGHYSDGSSEDLTTFSDWSSSDTEIATIESQDDANPGLAHGVAGGQASISAVFDGVLGDATLNVTPAVLETILVTPDPAIVPVGEHIQFAAMGWYSDGSNLDVTEMAGWGSSNTDIATIQTAGDGYPGLAYGVSLGQVTIAANLDGIVGDAGLTVGTGTSVPESPDEALRPFGAFPNPFNPQTTVQFSLPESGIARLDVYDTNGRRVRTLLEGFLGAGVHTVDWDGKDDSGSELSSGLYFSCLKTEAGLRVGKLTLIR